MTTNFTELEKRRVDYSDEPILIYREGEEEKLEIHAPEKKTEAITQLPLPNWAVTPITAINPDIIYAPSGHIVDEQEETRTGISPLVTQDRSSSQNSRFGRGLLIHKLLERLPNLTLSQREPVGKLFLRRSGRFNDDEANTILRRVLSIIEDPTFGAVFHADALAETPIAGFINGKRFAGVIDRLIVTEDLVQIVDFKTNRPPPLDPETTPKEYLKQMAIYRELAKQAFSGKEILTGILWTEAPRLDVLTDNQLDAFTPQNTAVD
jgi:ATP-dependent helicase/nuclease subunit A